MADFTATRVGAINQGTDKKAIFLKVFSGEVIKAFDQTTVTKGRLMERTVQNQKSAQFPAMSIIGTEYHVPGSELNGLNSNHAERIINIDDKLTTHAFIADIDEAMNHYDIRSEYSHQMGQALATTYDIDRLRETLLSSRVAYADADVADGTRSVGLISRGATSADATGADATARAAVPLDQPGGGFVSVGSSAVNLAGAEADYIDTTTLTIGQKLAAALYTARQKLAEKNIPNGDVYSYFAPFEYFQLASETENINMDWKGKGSYAEGKIAMIAGIPIIMAPSMASAGLTATTTVYNDASTPAHPHAVDASVTKGIVAHRSAAGTIKLRGLKMQREDSVRHQGSLMVGTYLVGHGWLRPSAAIEIGLNGF